ncbi:MAG: hypothetical protein NVSMB56_09610 [Pyrinomonadaceae bacterium]
MTNSVVSGQRSAISYFSLRSLRLLSAFSAVNSASSNTQLIFALTTLIYCLLCSTSFAQNAQPTSHTTEKSTYETTSNDAQRKSITGRVLAEDGQPLANAQVSLRSRSTARRQDDSATTDADGNFLVDNLAPGVYSVDVYAAGYVRPPTNENAPRSFYRPGDKVNLRLIKGGVITGKVTNLEGEPVIAAPVHLLRLRDTEGNLVNADEEPFNVRIGRKTDDRGVYRLYGLPPGVYIVYAGGTGSDIYGFGPNAYQSAAYTSDAPTFYPSTSRDGATEVTLHGGQEMSGIDIRYRGESGHTVSGKIARPKDAAGRGFANVALRDAASGTFLAQNNVRSDADADKFIFNGVADGEYDLIATIYAGQAGDIADSPAQRITVRGADIANVILTVMPRAGIGGRLVVEASGMKNDNATCPVARPFIFQETIVTARRDEKIDAKNVANARPKFNTPRDDAADKHGEFKLRSLEAGHYRLSVNLHDENFYVRSIRRSSSDENSIKPSNNSTKSTTQASPKAKTSIASSTQIFDVARDGVQLNSGDHPNNVVVTLTSGAAVLRGRINTNANAENPANANEANNTLSLPANLHVYLVPTEKERGDDVLRYGVARIRRDGTFTFHNIAPGNYRLLLKTAPEKSNTDSSAPPDLISESQTRAALRREAETNGTTVELQPCQRLNDFALRYMRYK